MTERVRLSKTLAYINGFFKLYPYWVYLTPSRKIIGDLHRLPIEWNHPTSATVLSRSWWKSMPMSISGPWRYFPKTSRDPLTNIYGQSSFLSGPGRSSFSGVLISPVVPKAMWCICVHYIPLWPIAVCEIPSQSKVAIMPINIRSVILENIVQLSGLGLSQNMKRISGVPQTAVYKFYAAFVEAAYMGIYWRQSKSPMRYFRCRQGPFIDIDLNFQQLWGNTVALVRWFHSTGGWC